MAKFKYTLKELYKITDEIVLEMENSNKSQRDSLVESLLEVTKELVHNNCKRFIIDNRADELEVDDLFHVATSIALTLALNSFDTSRGNHFLKYWHIVMERQFFNEFETATTYKAKIRQQQTVSGDAEVGECGFTLFSNLSTEEDFTESLCNSAVLKEALEEFERVYPLGKLIRCELIGSKDIKTKARLHVLGAETYGTKERYHVSHTKKAFKKFLMNKGITLDMLKK